MISSTVLATEQDCFIFSGEIQVWNGWPSAIRLHDKEENLWYGIPDCNETEDCTSFNHEAFLMKLVPRFRSRESLSGDFCLAKLGTETRVPYQEFPIILVRVVRFKFN